MTGRLSAQVAGLCDELRRDLPPGPLRDTAAAVRRRVDEPLRVAVAGRLKAGKSTLVNALLATGFTVAPTGKLETTLIVTWFRYGRPARAVARLAGGESADFGWPGTGMLPTPPANARVERVEVAMPARSLQGITLIDTPGFGSLTEGLAERTLKVLAADSHDAVSQADALLWVINNQAPHEDEAAMLAAFRSASGLRLSALNAFGLLNKADVAGDGREDPFERAHEHALQARTSLRGLVADVLPVSSLLAETAEVLQERDADALAALAAQPPEERRRMLLSVGRFSAAEAPGGDGAALERLLERLGLYGIRRCLEWIDEGVSGAPALSEQLRVASGFGELRRVLDEEMRPRTDALKAEAALGALERASYRAGDGDAEAARRVRAAVERLRLRPEMAQLAAISAYQRVSSGELELPAELAADLLHLARGSSVGERLGAPGAAPGELDRALGAATERWLDFAARAPFAERQVADAIVGVYGALDEELLEATA